MNLNRLTTFIVALSGLFVILLLSYFLLFRNNNKSPYQINTSSTAVVKEMRSLNRLETASFTIEKIIDAGTQGNVFQQFLFGDKILLIAHGEVIAGFDLSEISEKDVVINNSTLNLLMPRPKILITSIDNTQTRVYDRKRGLLNREEKNLESEARLAAEKSIRDAACKAGILDQAAQNARKQLTAMFTFSFRTVVITIPQGTCN